MTHSLFADLALLLHLAFILFAILGGLLVLYRHWFAWIHIPAVLWAAVVNMTPWLCPLTPLENYFRAQAGQEGYVGGFVANYIAPIIYPGVVTQDVILALAIAVVCWNLLVYGFVIYKIRSSGS
ncbi:MAG: DUF2784 domain-containing protein [Proteobacteria bacterium]|nr:DUF2784 domain-containing protein [Pseudomonadota bacterium]